jgi:hypothetical protein
MRERLEVFLRVACLILVACLLYQVAKRVKNSDPLGQLTIPTLPSYVSTNATPGGKATNSVAIDAAGKGTNAAHGDLASKGTNAIARQAATRTGTNSAGSLETTNAVSVTSTNQSTNLLATRVAGKAHTNSPTIESASEPAASGTRASKAAAAPAMMVTNTVGEAKPELYPGGSSNSAMAVRTLKTGTNPLAAKGGSNSVLQVELGKNGTNSSARSDVASKKGGPSSRPDLAMGGPNRPERPGMPPKAPELPPEILARVDRVVDSELLGPVFHPLPMALMGIAGDVAFLRSPSGQTGLVKEGDELGGIKLLRIGINRVLVEQEGKKQELTIFNGYGSESLLPK